MIEPRVRCMVVVPGGPSRRVGANGILIGRQHDCDIVVEDPSASRRHALVRLTGTGAEVVPLGRAPVEVNGSASATAVALADGDILRVPGLELQVKVDVPPPERGAPAGFQLERAAGGRFGIAHTPFTIGGGDADDLIVASWPPAAVLLHLAQGELFVELRAQGPVEHNGEPLAAGAFEPVAVGDTLACAGETFAIAHAGGRVVTTAVSAASALPSRVVIEMLPRGGRVVVTVGGREHAAYLADRRFDLIVALLRPPAGYAAGEFIPDDTVRAVVWPRRPAVSRQEINMLISRCRRDLVDVGLAGPRLLERAPGGGGTRFVLGAGATIDVRG